MGHGEGSGVDSGIRTLVRSPETRCVSNMEHPAWVWRGKDPLLLVTLYQFITGFLSCADIAPFRWGN